MKCCFYKLCAFFSLFILFEEVKAEGYEFKIRIKNLANKEIILGHHFADKLYPDDTLKLDNSGQGTLKGNTKFPEGLYFFMTPSRAIFEFFMTANQQFSIETDTLNLFESLKFTNSPENSAALEYRRALASDQREAADLQEKKKKLTDRDELKKTESKISEISGRIKLKTNTLIDAQHDNFVGPFVKAMQEIVVPEAPLDSDGKVLDSLFQYRYYRAHFFDNINLKDVRFLRTPLYNEKIKLYIEKVIPQIPDTIIGECDKLLELAASDKELFRYMLITLFNHYASSTIMGFDAVYAHLAEKWYIPKATFSDTAFVRKTAETVKKLKPLLLGKTAQDLRMLWLPAEHFIQAKTDSIARINPHYGSFINLHQIEAKFTILVFWESDCSHCKKTIPQLYEVYQRMKPKGVAVFSVHMLGGIEGKNKWIDFVNEHELYDWFNVWNPYDYTYKKMYDISSTPVVFILDKNKKIIGKKLEPKQIEEYLNALLKQEEKKK